VARIDPVTGNVVGWIDLSGGWYGEGGRRARVCLCVCVSLSLCSWMDTDVSSRGQGGAVCGYACLCVFLSLGEWIDSLE